MLLRNAKRFMPEQDFNMPNRVINMPNLVIMKFGGTSVEDAKAMARTAP